ncbi:SRPBCC family protein [Pelagibius sp. Alg239-R121]|uniref:SRPBCC family protein n=1 Tax=Pelagibius sp. Alg239-R121 TaxID=2993448 RepID=UPI0024A63A5D|nr:SRPBCC family protein [Pelagibius sp. Alg239-R121]
MKFATFVSLAAFAASGLGGASGANATDVMKSAVIDHPAEEVWALIGEYGHLDKWHPAVVKLELSGDGGNGLFRTLTLPDGAVLKEKLQSYSLDDMSYSYSIVEGPLPVQNYVSKITVRPGDTAGQSVIEWSSSFEPAGVEEAEAQKIIGGIYTAGFDGINDKLK